MENLLEQLLCQSEYAFVHETPIGCISDMCMYKTDLNLKILTAYICPNCLDLMKNNLDEESINAFQTLCELARDYAFNRIKSEKPIEEDKLLFPVAVYLRKLKGESDIEKKFNLLLDLFDITVRTTTLIIYARVKELDSDYKAVVETKIPSLGDWVECFNQSLKKLKELNDNFFLSFFNDLGEAYKLITREMLVNLRNDTRGHSFSLAPYEVNDYFQKYNPIINSLVKLLNKFLSLNLVRVIHLRHKRNFGYELEAYNLNSSNPIFEKLEFIVTPIEIKQEVLSTENEIILFNENQKDYLSLQPYLIHANCPSCGQPRTLIIDYDNKYLDIQMGHRIEILKGELSRC